MYMQIRNVEKASFLTDSHFENSIGYKVSQEEIWNKIVDSMTFEFDLKARKSIISSHNLLDSYKTISKFEKAIYEYLEEKSEKKHLKDISKVALKNFLYLLPIFEIHSPDIAIDSDTGFVDTTFNTRDNGLFTALVTESGEIHYSRVSKGVKIYKFSGVAKIKDSRDFKHFAKVLEML